MKKELYFETHIFCCTNKRLSGKECCADKNSEELRNYMKNQVKNAGIKKARVNSSGCLDRCELGAVMVVYPEGIWYSYKTKTDVDEIVNSHIKGGKIVQRLVI